MYFGAIQICGERLNTRDCKEFCDALDEHKIKMLALRECGISTKNFKRLMDSIGYCKSILHLNLSICGLHCQNRVDMLAAALNANNSLTALLLHGNHFGTEGMAKLIRPLIINSHIACLDVGDCDLGDKGLKYVCELLPSDDNKPGLQELVLSGNPNISSKAWEKFTVAVAASSSLKALYLDFNNIGETAGKMLVVAAAGHKSLNIIDLEACDLTEDVGKLLLFLLQHYPTTLTHVMLEENDITDETKYSIRIALGESESEESSSDDDDCLPIERHPSFTEHHMDDRTHSQRCKRETAPSCLDKKKKSEEDVGILTDISVHRSREGRRQKSSNSGAGANQEEEIKYKIQLQEVSESSDITDNRNVDVTYEFKPTEKSNPVEDQHAKCKLEQEVVEVDGKKYLRIHGDCEGGSVLVRLRNKNPEGCRNSVDHCQQRRSTVSKCTVESSDDQCCLYRKRKQTARCDEQEEPCRSKNLCGSSRRHSSLKRHKHRASLGLTDDAWNEDADKKSCKDKTRCSGRGPWCGRGSVRHLEPLKRMEYVRRLTEERGTSAAVLPPAQSPALSPRSSAPPAVSSPRPSEHLDLPKLSKHSASEQNLMGTRDN